ncbi:MAG TPA: hypothetical protein PLA77_08475, partial [Bacteroidales bacterium]|nr:hypothetical protein [Bacteroidales bacterium]
MKKRILLFVGLLVFFTVFKSITVTYACTGGTSQGALTMTDNWQTRSGVLAGNYWTFTATAGSVYIFSFCQGGGVHANDPQIQIMNSSGTPVADGYNDDHCGYGSELVWVCPAGGTYRVGFYQFNCIANGTTALGTFAYRHLPTPTYADCLGARPLCGMNNTVNSLEANGGGNYYDLFNYNASWPGGWNPVSVNANNCPFCMITGERYTSWYRFTATNNGTLTFTITPNVISQDFDWALWDMTGRQCSELLRTNSASPGLAPISCNYCGVTGTTGVSASGATNCTYHQSGCNRFNPTINVTAGHVYYLVIDNFSNTTDGYSIAFGGTVNNIVDNSYPVLSSIVYPPVCGQNNVTVQFSEAVSCTSMLNSCITITGPNGPLTVTDIWSQTCESAAGSTWSSGTFYDMVWTIEFSQFLTAGTYTISLTPNCARDLCNNTMPTGTTSTLSFTVTGITATLNQTNPTCAWQNTGSASVTGVSGGAGPPFSYYWTGPSGYTSTASSITNLVAGNYNVTVSDAIGNCVWTNTAVLTGTAAPPNDNCANAFPVGALPVTSPVLSTQCATNDYNTGLPGCGGSFGANVWFTVVGTGNLMEANTVNASTNFDTEIHIFTGACGSLTEVACNDD